MYLTMIEFDDDLLTRMEKICEDISVKDKSFNFKIYPSKFKRDWILVLSSPTHSQAHRRGCWMVKKAFPLEDLLYWTKAS